jgi:hypothetical protein
MSQPVYIENGTDVNAAWYGSIAVSYDNVNWQLISKEGLSVKPRYVSGNISNPPGVIGPNVRTMISLSDFSGATLFEFECNDVINQATWNGKTKAALQTAVEDLGVWIGELYNSTTAIAGNVGGFTFRQQVTQVTSAAAIYAAGDSVGGKITLTNAVRISGGTGILTSIDIIDKSAQNAPGNILIFDSDPTAATITDNAPFVFSTDIAKLIANIPVVVGDYSTFGTISTANIGGLARVVKASGSANLYACFVTSGTPTYATTSDILIGFGILQD